MASPELGYGAHRWTQVWFKVAGQPRITDATSRRNLLAGLMIEHFSLAWGGELWLK